MRNAALPLSVASLWTRSRCEIANFFQVPGLLSLFHRYAHRSKLLTRKKRGEERRRKGEGGKEKEENGRAGEINSVISFQICISCCDLSYCNIESPTNSTNAIFSRKRRAKSKSKRKRPGRNGVEGNRFYGGGGALWLLASLFYAYHC